MSSTKTVIESFREVVPDLLVPELKSMKISIDALRREMELRDQRQDQAMRHLSEKLDFAIDIRERMASLEARLPRQ